MPDLMLNNHGDLVRVHIPHARTDAAERFAALVQEIDCGLDLPCLVFQGGDTFRVDEQTVTTPRRFAYELVTGERLPKGKKLKMICTTPNCCRWSHVKE